MLSTPCHSINICAIEMLYLEEKPHLRGSLRSCHPLWTYAAQWSYQILLVMMSGLNSSEYYGIGMLFVRMFYVNGEDFHMQRIV